MCNRRRLPGQWAARGFTDYQSPCRAFLSAEYARVRLGRHRPAQRQPIVPAVTRNLKVPV